MLWEDSEQVLDKSYAIKIDDHDFEIEDDAQLYDYGNDLEAPQFEKVLVEDGFEMLSPKFVLNAQLCVALVPQLAPKMSKERRDYLVQLEDPFGMVFTRESFGWYGVKFKFLHHMVDDSWYALESSVVTYVEEV